MSYVAESESMRRKIEAVAYLDVGYVLYVFILQ